MKDLKEMLVKTHGNTTGQARTEPGTMIPEAGTVLTGGGQTLTVDSMSITADGIAYIKMDNGQTVEARQLAGWIADGTVTAK